MTRAMPNAGHFICGDRCRFVRHHHVNGRWCVSTVGDLHYTEDGPREEVGFQRAYETMVFDLKRTAKAGRWRNVDFEGYQSADSAAKGHARLLRRWARKARA